MDCILKEIGLEPQLIDQITRQAQDCTLKEIGLEPQQGAAIAALIFDCTLKEIGLEPQPSFRTLQHLFVLYFKRDWLRTAT